MKLGLVVISTNQILSVFITVRHFGCTWKATAGGYTIAVLLFATCMVVGYLTPVGSSGDMVIGIEFGSKCWMMGQCTGNTHI